MNRDYCPYCKRVTEQIKEMNKKLCKRCGKMSKTTNVNSLLTGK